MIRSFPRSATFRFMLTITHRLPRRLVFWLIWRLAWRATGRVARIAWLALRASVGPLLAIRCWAARRMIGSGPMAAMIRLMVGVVRAISWIFRAIPQRRRSALILRRGARVMGLAALTRWWALSGCVAVLAMTRSLAMAWTILFAVIPAVTSWMAAPAVATFWIIRT